MWVKNAVEGDKIRIESTLRAKFKKSCHFQKAAVTLPQELEKKLMLVLVALHMKFICVDMDQLS